MKNNGNTALGIIIGAGILVIIFLVGIGVYNRGLRVTFEDEKTVESLVDQAGVADDSTEAEEENLTEDSQPNNIQATSNEGAVKSSKQVAGQSTTNESVPAIVERVFIEIKGQVPTESESTYWKNQFRDNNLTEAQLKSKMQEVLGAKQAGVTETATEEKSKCLQAVALLKIDGNKILRTQLTEKEKEYQEAMRILQERRYDIIVNRYQPELSPDQNKAIMSTGVNGVDINIQALERRWLQIKTDANQLAQDVYEKEELKCEAGI